MAFISNGTTILDAGAFSASLGSMVHIKTLTASSSANLSFVHGSSGVVLNNTYPIYLFKFINIHPASHIELAFNASTDTGSSYNVAKTTTTTSAYHGEGGQTGGNNSFYYIDEDLAQGTGVARISGDCYTDNDSSISGEMYLFNPASTTYVKHFISTTQRMDYSSVAYTNQWACGGYLNTTSAVDAIQFSMVSGNMDAGTIKLYGIKDS